MERIEMMKSTLTFLFLIFANTEATPTYTVEPTGSADNAQPCRGCDLNHADCIMGVCSCEPGWAGDYCDCAQTPNALCESQQPIANETLCSHFRPYAICYLTELLEKAKCHCSTYNINELAAGKQLPNVQLTSKDMSQMKICRFTLNNVTYDFVVQPSGATVGARYNVMVSSRNMQKNCSYAIPICSAIGSFIIIVFIIHCLCKRRVQSAPQKFVLTDKLNETQLMMQMSVVDNNSPKNLDETHKAFSNVYHE